MSKTVNEYRQDEEFLKLETQVAQLHQQQEELWHVLKERFPAPEGMHWCLMANHSLMVCPKYGEA